MTNEQMAIIKARAIIIKLEEAVKILEDADKKSVLMWDWWNKTEINFTEEQDTEYLYLYIKSRALDKKIKELTE